MTFLERLDFLLEDHDLNKNQLANATGIPVSTIYGWYKKGYNSITLPSLLKLSEFFNCSMEYLVNGNPADSDSPSAAALDLAHKYDQLNDYSKKVVTALVDLELKRPNSRYDAANDDIGAVIRSREEAESSIKRHASSKG